MAHHQHVHTHSAHTLTPLQSLHSLHTISHTSQSKLGLTPTTGSQDDFLAGDFIAILKGYASVLSLDEMKALAHDTHQVDVPRERRIACCLIIFGLIIFLILLTIYLVLISEYDYDLQDDRIVMIEICAVSSILMMGMCLFRWCSLNDISPKTIWQRVAVVQATPLRFIKFDMENVNITFVEYDIDYGEFPHNLHEPIILLKKQEQICNARDLVKITKKEPDPDQAYSYGAIYFHFKGKDEYLLERWKYEFEKYHRKVDAVYKSCNKFHNAFFQQFGYKFRHTVVSEDDEEQKYDLVPTKVEITDDMLAGGNIDKKPKQHQIVITPQPEPQQIVEEDEDDDEFYYNTHEMDNENDDASSSLGNNSDADIDPALLGGKKEEQQITNANAPQIESGNVKHDGMNGYVD